MIEIVIVKNNPVNLKFFLPIKIGQTVALKISLFVQKSISSLLYFDENWKDRHPEVSGDVDFLSKKRGEVSNNYDYTGAKPVKASLQWRGSNLDAK